MSATESTDSSAGGTRTGRRSPFDDVVPSVVAAVVFAALALGWIAVGERFPGGRWLAVHLFTLGVVSNVILAFSRHFTHTLTKVPERTTRRLTVVAFNAGAVTVMAGMVGAWPIVVAVGATVATLAVLASYLDLRRSRHDALGARFAWVVRCYERAHGAFVHGAVLGGLLGSGVLAGAWYAPARTAHLHVNLLGWAGVTLLATLVFFGPTMARTRIEKGADERAARTIRWGAHAVTIAALALLGTGFAGALGDGLRLVAAAALAAFAWAATDTCRAVGRAVAGARPGAARALLLALCWWLPLLVWADALVVATGSWRHLDALGLGVLLGVLAQAITATLTYLAPMLAASRSDDRDAVRSALDRFARTRSVVLNLGVCLLVATAVAGTGAGAAGSAVARIGWVLGAAALVQPAVVVAVAR